MQIGLVRIKDFLEFVSRTERFVAIPSCMRDKGKGKTEEIPETKEQRRTEEHFQGNVSRKGEFFRVIVWKEFGIVIVAIFVRIGLLVFVLKKDYIEIANDHKFIFVKGKTHTSFLLFN